MSDAPSVHTRRVFYTTSDIKTLKHRFEEPHLYRAHAANTISIIRGLHEMDSHTQVEYLRWSLDFIRASPPEDNERVVAYGGPNEGDLTVGSELSKLETLVQHNLDREAGEEPPASQKQKVHDIPTSQSVYMYRRKGSFDEETKKREEELLKRTRGGGFFCNGCKRSKEELGIEELRRCNRCKMLYYCSSECLLRAWEAGHNKSCRKKGQVKVGDDMRLMDLVNQKELNGQFVQVIRPGMVEDKWIGSGATWV